MRYKSSKFPIVYLGAGENSTAVGVASADNVALGIYSDILRQNTLGSKKLLNSTPAPPYDSDD